MLKISQYPHNADGTPMSLEVGVLTDSSGNSGARMPSAPVGPDGAPINAKALILIDQNGDPYRFNSFMKPEDYGAVGDGVTNDQPAFDLMNAKAASLGYCHVELTPGKTYMVGGQAGDGTYYLNSINAIEATNLASLIIVGNGATLKTNPGLKYGTFDPVTGLPLGTYSTLAANTARGPASVVANGCATVRIDDLHLDGNPTAFTIGNNTASTNLEAHHYGFQIVGCKEVAVTNFSAVGFLEDCLIVANSGAVETDTDKPQTYTNGILDNCGRNCLSITGGVNVVFDNVHCTNPASALHRLNSAIGTLPSSAIDIEAESAVNRRLVFRLCTFEQGPNGVTSLASGSGDSKNILFESCRLVGAVIAGSPKMTFRRCSVYGYFKELYTNTSAQDALVFDDCFLTDATFGNTPLLTISGQLFFGTGGNGVIFRNTNIDISRSKVAFGNSIVRDTTVTIRTGTDSVASGSAILSLSAGTYDNLTVVDAIVANIPSSYLVTWTAGSATIRNGNIVSATPVIKWKSATGFAGAYDSVIGRKGVDVQSANFTMDVSLSKEVQEYDSALAANKTATLPAPVAGLTRRYRIVRTANATGISGLTVQTSALVALRVLSAASTWAEVYSDNGAEYVLTASGALQDTTIAPIGYATGAGGTVTQATSKATGVTKNTLCGQITMNAAALAASTTVSFVLTNSQIAAGDLLILNHVSGGTLGSYALNAHGSAAGSVTIDVRNVSLASLSEAIVIGFAVIKAVTA